MTRGYIRYRSEYKYQLASEYRIKIPILPTGDIVTEFIDLDTGGELTVKNAYAWDGPSGPVIDTPENMRASLQAEVGPTQMVQRAVGLGVPAAQRLPEQVHGPLEMLPPVFV